MFSSLVGRNQPSTTKFVYGLSAWLRGLIQAREGFRLAYVDWSQHEFGIAAALSHDVQMQAAYRSGDPYLEFAQQAGAVPPDATKHSHKREREQFKACVLAAQYGMGETTLGERIGQSPAYVVTRSPRKSEFHLYILSLMRSSTAQARPQKGSADFGWLCCGKS
jgi:hypothetical protein